MLVADDDPYSRAVLEAVLTASGHACTIVSNGREAWNVLQRPDAPKVAFLDWMMPEIDGTDICRMLRERTEGEYTYVVILSSRNKQSDITLGFQSGADDFITKPYNPEDILARIQVAERISLVGSTGLAQVLAEACESPSGDVIARTLRRVGRIIFHGGRIAWAHVSDEPGSLAAILASEPDISREDVAAVLEECRGSGQNFADVLVAWDLISRERLRVVLREWTRAKIATIAAFPLPVVLFSPEPRAAPSGVLFDPAEVLPPAMLRELARRLVRASDAVTARSPAGAVSGPHAATAMADDQVVRLAADLDRALAIEGARSVAVFDLRDGQCMGMRGDSPDLDLVWSQLRLATQSDLLEDLEDIMISTRKYIHLVRWYTRSPRRLLFLTLDRRSTLGLARHALAKCSPESP